MSLKDTVNRLMGRSVVDLAGEVDAALGRLAEARGLEAQCVEALGIAEQDVLRAQRAVAAARDALFAEHPDLRPEGTYIEMTPPPAPDLHPHFESEVIEIDDDNDPRYTGGASSIPVSDDEPLPPIMWEEHDG